MLSLTTEQQAPVHVAAKDGRGRPKPLDNIVLASSDETLVRCSEPRKNEDGSFDFDIVAVSEGGPARVTVNADADLSETVQDIIGVVDEITVTLDPRTAERQIDVTPGTPVDQPTT